MASFIIEKHKRPHNKMCSIAIEKAEELARDINTNPWHPTNDLRGFLTQLSNAVEAQRMRQPPNVSAGQVEITIYDITMDRNHPRQAIGIRKPGDRARNIATITLAPDETTERYG